MSTSGGSRTSKKALFNLSKLSDVFQQLSINTITSKSNMKDFGQALNRIIGSSSLMTQINKGQVSSMYHLAEAFGLSEAAIGITERRLDSFFQIMRSGGKINIKAFKQTQDYWRGLVNVRNAIVDQYLPLKKNISLMEESRAKGFLLLGPMFSTQYALREMSKLYKTLLAQGFEFTFFLEDLQWAFADIADVLSEALAPGLELIINVLELVADWVEHLPTPLQALFGVMVLGAMVALTLLANLMQLLVGFFAIRAALVQASMEGNKFAGTLLSISGASKKAGRYLKKNLGKAALGISSMVAGFFLLGPIMESMAPIFEAMGSVTEVLIDWFEPLIDIIADFIEENPELIAGMLLAVVGAILTMKATDFIGWLKGLFSGVSQVGDKIPSLSTNTGNLAKNIIALAGAVGILMLSLAGAIWILDQTSFTIPQIISLMGALTATVIGLTGTFLIFGIIMGVTGVTLAPLIPIILALSLAMLGFGAAVFLASTGISFMVDSMSRLLGAIRGLRGTRISLLGLGGIMLGGIEIASLAEGGLIKGEGFAYLHPDEVVTPAGGSSHTERNVYYQTFHIEGTVRSEEDFERIAKKVSEIQDREQRSSSYG